MSSARDNRNPRRKRSRCSWRPTAWLSDILASRCIWSWAPGKLDRCTAHAAIYERNFHKVDRKSFRLNFLPALGDLDPLNERRAVQHRQLVVNVVQSSRRDEPLAGDAGSLQQLEIIVGVETIHNAGEFRRVVHELELQIVIQTLITVERFTRLVGWLDDLRRRIVIHRPSWVALDEREVTLDGRAILRRKNRKVRLRRPLCFAPYSHEPSRSA